MMEAFYFRHDLKFKKPSGTSRGVLLKKTSWFIVVKENEKIGVGECSLIDGLSPDPLVSFEKTLKEVCHNINLGDDYFYKKLLSYPSILFGYETALLSLKSKTPFILYPSPFTNQKKKHSN